MKTYACDSSQHIAWHIVVLTQYSCHPFAEMKTLCFGNNLGDLQLPEQFSSSILFQLWNSFVPLKGKKH